MGIVKKKIADYRFNGLVRRFLKSSTLKSDGSLHKNNCGTPQGGVMSPILANIYLNEVVDQWFLENYGSYNNIIVRYADDAVAHCQTGKEAETLLDKLHSRFNECGLELHPDKTRIVYCKDDDRVGDYPNISFDFLSYLLT